MDGAKKMKMKIWLMVSVLLLGACTAEEREVKGVEIQNEEESLIFNFGKAQEIGEVGYEVLNFSSTESISPPNPGSVTSVLSVENPESQFLDLSLNLKNLGTTEKLASELLDITYTIGEKEYSTFKRYESNNASMFEDGEFNTIQPLTNTVVHYIAEVPTLKVTEEIKIDAVLNGKAHTTKLTLEEMDTNRNYITTGQALEVPQYADLTLENVYYTDNVSPPNPGSVFTYYEPETQTNTLLVLEMRVKNLKSSGLQADSIAAAKVVYDQYYEFDGFPAVLKSDASGFDPANITSIPSLNENVLFYIIEVPKELKETKGVLAIWFNNGYYHFPIDSEVTSQQVPVSEDPEVGAENDDISDSFNQENSNKEEESKSNSDVTEAETNDQSGTDIEIKKGHTQMTTQETLDLISHNEGIDFSTYSHNMYFDANGYLVIEVGLGEMAVGTYKIDGDGTLLQLDVESGLYIPAEQVQDGGS